MAGTTTPPAPEATAELDRVRALRATLVITHPFWATLLLPMPVRLTTALPTFAATDGRTIWLNPRWTAALTLRQLGYVLVHELGHVALLHPLRRGARKPYLWNVACDAAVNCLVDQITDGRGRPLYDRPVNIAIPGVGTCSGIHLDWAKDLAAEQIYERLRAEQPPQPSCCPQHAAGHPDAASGTAPDPHAPNLQGTHCSPGETCVQLPGTFTDTDAEALVGRVLAAHEAWQASNRRGDLPGALLRLIDRLRAARVPWQRVLRQYAGTALASEDFSLFPPHKRWLAQEDLVRPTCRSERMGQLAVAIDTSGSIDRRTLQMFASEIAALHTLSEETLLLTCDAQVHQVIRTQQVPTFLASLSLRGGGGTSHVPVFRWLAEHRTRPDLLVALTDLYTKYPERRPPYPVLWVAPEAHGEAPPWGRLVIIPGEEQEGL